MIEIFNVRKERPGETVYETLHFELKLDGKEYKGHYKDDEVDWFQMQPDQEDHAMPLEELDAKVKERLANWVEE